MEKLYTVAKTRPGADCGSDHQLHIAKFRLKLKKVGKTIRLFRKFTFWIRPDLPKPIVMAILSKRAKPTVK